MCFILPGLSYLSADIYRWTDKEGVVHFGNSAPSDAQDVKVVSKEISSGPAAGAPAPGPDAKSTESILQELEDDLQREREARKQADEIKKTAPPTHADIIAREKARLEKKITELDQKPIEYYGGSPKIKSVADGLLRIPAAGADGGPGQLLQKPGARTQLPCAR